MLYDISVAVDPYYVNSATAPAQEAKDKDSSSAIGTSIYNAHMQ